MVQLREDIAESKVRYELVDDTEQVILKNKIIDNIQKYFYIIVFGVYMREEIALSKDNTLDASNTLRSGRHAIPADQLQIDKSFVQFMRENESLKELIEEGKGSLQWERDIPADAWANLESLSTTDFKGNLGNIIHDIYSISHALFADLPSGPDKKRATYRFASKTLLKLLPAQEKDDVEREISKRRMALDLYDILGYCAWSLNSETPKF